MWRTKGMCNNASNRVFTFIKMNWIVGTTIKKLLQKSQRKCTKTLARVMIVDLEIKDISMSYDNRFRNKRH